MTPLNRFSSEYARKMGAKDSSLCEVVGKCQDGASSQCIPSLSGVVAEAEENLGAGEKLKECSSALASDNLCTICREPADKLFESPFSGDRICGECFDAEQEEAWGARPAEAH